MQTRTGTGAVACERGITRRGWVLLGRNEEMMETTIKSEESIVNIVQTEVPSNNGAVRMSARGEAPIFLVVPPPTSALSLRLNGVQNEEIQNSSEHKYGASAEQREREKAKKEKLTVPDASRVFKPQFATQTPTPRQEKNISWKGAQIRVLISGPHKYGAWAERREMRKPRKGDHTGKKLSVEIKVRKSRHRNWNENTFKTAERSRNLNLKIMCHARPVIYTLLRNVDFLQREMNVVDTPGPTTLSEEHAEMLATRWWTAKKFKAHGMHYLAFSMRAHYSMGFRRDLSGGYIHKYGNGSHSDCDPRVSGSQRILYSTLHHIES
jgi:hypothetical protein